MVNAVCLLKVVVYIYMYDLHKQPAPASLTSFSASNSMDFYPSLFAALHFMLLLFPSTSVIHSNFTDISALLAFRARFSDPHNILTTNWTIDASLCTWTGVSCSHRRQRVVSLRLVDIPLYGTIAPEVANMSFLSYIFLRNNSLVGPIPASLSQLPRLKVLSLEVNQLSGSIPPAIFNMSSLTQLYLVKNNLSGALPLNSSFPSFLPQIQKLSLSYNQLSGNIPSRISYCYDLQRFSLSYNQFTGTIPMEIGNLKQLIHLYLGANNLTGSIPASVGNLTNLLHLDLGENSLSGVIPGELGGHLNLQELILSLNHGITGSIPISLSNISSLVAMDLGDNKLSGSVRMDFGNMHGLQYLNLAANKLTGRLDFLGSLSNCRVLNMLNLWENELDDLLPITIGNLSRNLLTFAVGENHIKGKIPAELGNLTSLSLLHLSDNELVGTIPSEITLLENLQWISLANNKIHGHIPDGIGRLANLNLIDFDRNSLFGSIPESVGNISALERLSFNSNELSSRIPQSIWNLTHLIDLDLSYNLLSGPLSTGVGNTKVLDSLDVSTNQLSGGIPGAITELQMVTYLDLSSNSFDGEIPQSFDNLVVIKLLNLSCNNLTGSIPDSLANLRFLDVINLSFNRLEGKIPSRGVFLNLTVASLMGNAALCGGSTRLGFPPCPRSAQVSHSGPGVHLLEYILPAIVLIVMLVCFCILWRQKRTKRPSPGNTQSVDCNYRLISYHELVRATENFSEAKLLGEGRFGSVYRGCLDDGMPAAIKVLNMDVHGALRTFDVECGALRMVRHRNIVKIITTCSNLDFKALILQFMPNGSLEKWLYSHNYCLSLLQRFSIALDVASALEYLHHHCSQIIVHCDLKPSNVLLDEDMTAHVGDFGIAKLWLGDSSSTTTSTTVAGTIGYVPPEYASTGRVSRKGDVYSFGIMLLEIFTRKKPTDPTFGAESSLRQWVCEAHPTAVLDIVDRNLLKDGYGNEMPSKGVISMHACLSSILELGIICSKDSPNERLAMVDVVPKLQKIKRDYLSMFPVT